MGIDARLAGYAPGGIAQYTLLLAEALARLGGACYTLLRAARPREPQPPVPGARARRVWTPPHHRLEQWTLPLEVLPLGLDLLHSPDFIPLFHRRWRSVITIHDLAFLRFPETMTAESHRHYGQVARAVRSAERVIAVSRATRDDLGTLLGVGGERVRVIPHGLDPRMWPRPEDEQRRARTAYGLDGPYVLWVGTFEPRKNLPLLLEAFRALRARRPALTLALVGRRGWLDAPIFALLDSPEYSRGVRVLEGVPRADLPALYSGAALLAFPSRYEGFGLPALEAMGCGTPVVAASVSSLPEVVGDAGLLVPPDDAEALEAAMARVLDGPALAAALRARGLERARGFSWERAARATLAVYREAMR